jgi:hypothetical protein
MALSTILAPFIILVCVVQSAEALVPRAACPQDVLSVFSAHRALATGFCIDFNGIPLPTTMIPADPTPVTM